MHCPCGKLAICRVQKRAQKRHQEDEAAPSKALAERLGIPGKEGHRPDHGQVEETALYSPVDGGGRTGVVVCRFQFAVCLSKGLPVHVVRRSYHCKQYTRWSEVEVAFLSAFMHWQGRDALYKPKAGSREQPVKARPERSR